MTREKSIKILRKLFSGRKARNTSEVEKAVQQLLSIVDSKDYQDPSSWKKSTLSEVARTPQEVTRLIQQVAKESDLILADGGKIRISLFRV